MPVLSRVVCEWVRSCAKPQTVTQITCKLQGAFASKLHTTLFTGRLIQVVLKTIFKVDSEEVLRNNLAWLVSWKGGPVSDGVITKISEVGTVN